MPQGRPPIPAELERALFIEAGYRCAVPRCQAVAPLTIDHIEDWARVKEHKFANMIVLCRNCHGLKGEGPRKLDRKALRQIKANLGIINGRYGELERRMLMFLAGQPKLANGDTYQIRLPGGLELMLWYLIKDGMLVPMRDMTPMFVDDVPLMQDYRVTDACWELVAQLRDAQPVPL
jgi:HNH endonuclease